MPLLFNYAEGGKTPPVTPRALRRAGLRLVIFPISTLLDGDGGDPRGPRADQGTTARRSNCSATMLPFDEFLDFIGLPEIRELEQRFATDPTTP